MRHQHFKAKNMAGSQAVRVTLPSGLTLLLKRVALADVYRVARGAKAKYPALLANEISAKARAEFLEVVVAASLGDQLGDQPGPETMTIDEISGLDGLAILTWALRGAPRDLKGVVQALERGTRGTGAGGDDRKPIGG